MDAKERKGNRLSKIVTRTGDAGETGLGDGSRLLKNAPRVAAIGNVDELNSALGVLRCEMLPKAMDHALSEIQHDLFELGGELCIPDHALMRDAQVQRLEHWASEWNASLPALKEFILPGGTRPAALAHICRTVCRRAERSLIALHQQEMVSAVARRYINRLSDLLFIAARWLNQYADHPDVLWQSREASEDE